MEDQVDFLGIDTALKLVPIWHLCSLDGFCTGFKLFMLKVKPHLYTHFLDCIHFFQMHNMHTLIVFSIAKGLAMCRLGGGGGGGGVISTQKSAILSSI